MLCKQYLKKCCRALSDVYTWVSSAFILEVKCNSHTRPCILETSDAECKLRSKKKKRQFFHIRRDDFKKKRKKRTQVEMSKRSLWALGVWAERRRSTTWLQARWMRKKKKACRVKEMSQWKSASPPPCCNDPSRARSPLAPSPQLICPCNVTGRVQSGSWRILTLAILNLNRHTHRRALEMEETFEIKPRWMSRNKHVHTHTHTHTHNHVHTVLYVR